MQNLMKLQNKQKIINFLFAFYLRIYIMLMQTTLNKSIININLFFSLIDNSLFFATIFLLLFTLYKETYF